MTTRTYTHTFTSPGEVLKVHEDGTTYWPFEDQLKQDYTNLLREELVRLGVASDGRWAYCSKVTPTAVKFCIDRPETDSSWAVEVASCEVYRLNQTIPPDIKLAALKLIVQL